MFKVKIVQKPQFFCCNSFIGKLLSNIPLPNRLTLKQSAVYSVQCTVYSGPPEAPLQSPRRQYLRGCGGLTVTRCRAPDPPLSRGRWRCGAGGRPGAAASSSCWSAPGWGTPGRMRDVSWKSTSWFVKNNRVK